MRAWIVLVAAGCGGAAPDAPTDAATTGTARVSWAIRQGASQTGCEQAYELAGSVDPSTGDVVAGEVTVTLDDNGWP